MKRIISILIVIILVMMMLNISYANDADVNISLSNETAKPGDTITLSLNINPTDDGIAGLQGKIKWNTEQLTYVSSQVDSEFTTLNFNEDNTSESLGMFSVYGNDYITDKATVFTVTFKVNEEITEETQVDINVTEIKAEYQTAGTVDIQDKKVSLSIISATTNEDSNAEENTNSTNQAPTNVVTNSSTQNVVVEDKTTAKTILPATGLKIVILFAIFIIFIVLIVSGKNYIQYLKDTKKQLK